MSGEFIRCQHCSAKIELPEFDVAVPALCGDCARKLYSTPSQSSVSEARTPASCSPDVVEIVEMLREEALAFGGSRFEDDDGNVLAALFNKAADALESMMREKDAMREALKRAQEFIHDKFCGCSPDDPEHSEECVAARAALDMTLDKGR